jgi:cell division protein FtsB
MLFIAILSAVVIYLGKKWSDARAENAELRTTVAVLKRRVKLLAAR